MTDGTAMRFSEVTTLRVGGEAATTVVLDDPATAVDRILEVWRDGEDWLVLGGGSNLLVGDEGFPGVVFVMATRGVERRPTDAGVLLRIQAGEPWDAVVARAVANGWSGIEALSGIPGSTGAAPIQNIGAYGQEVGATLDSVRFLDATTLEVVDLSAAELGLDYRTSAIKRGRSGVVLSVDLRLHESATSEPVAYDQLARSLGVEAGAEVPLAEVRRAVLALRGAKGMLLDPSDPDSVSAGSFFTNPIVSENFARGLPAETPRWPVTPEAPDVAVPLDAIEDVVTPGVRRAPSDFLVKLSAAWLIEHSGVTRGFSLPGSAAAISSKHTLSIVNRGGARADDILSLARFIQTRVASEFGVQLQPEPAIVNAAF